MVLISRANQEACSSASTFVLPTVPICLQSHFVSSLCEYTLNVGYIMQINQYCAFYL